MALLGDKYRIRHSAWYLPHFLFFFLSVLIEMFVKLLAPIKDLSMEYSIRAISSYTASVMMFNRLRAAIHMDYVPLIDVETSQLKSAKWYAKWWEENLSKGTVKNKKN